MIHNTWLGEHSMKRPKNKQPQKDIKMLCSIIESYIKTGEIKAEDPEYEVYQDIKRRNK